MRKCLGEAGDIQTQIRNLRLEGYSLANSHPCQRQRIGFDFLVSCLLFCPEEGTHSRVLLPGAITSAAREGRDELRSHRGVDTSLSILSWSPMPLIFRKQNLIIIWIIIQMNGPLINAFNLPAFLCIDPRICLGLIGT